MWIDARVGRRQPGQHAEQRRLAAAHGADDGHELAPLDRERHVLQHVSRPAFEGNDFDTP